MFSANAPQIESDANPFCNRFGETDAGIAFGVEQPTRAEHVELDDFVAD